MPAVATRLAPIIVVDTTGLTEEQWLEYRRKGIGGSDAAAVMGASPFKTARELYFDKSGTPLADTTETNKVNKRVGRLLEPVVADIFEERTGFLVEEDKNLYRHPDHPFMLANIDRKITLPDGSIGLLELKTTNVYMRDEWDGGAVPYHYEIQCRHYMAVFDLDFCYIACMFGTSEEGFVIRKIERDLEVEAELIEMEEYFWHAYVLKGVEPPFTEDGDLVINSLKRAYGDSKNTLPEIELDTAYASSLERVLALKDKKAEVDRQAKELDKEIKAAYADVADVMGQAATAVCRTGNIEYKITYKSSNWPTMPKEKLDLLKVEMPDVFNRFASTSGSRPFKVKRKEIA